MSQILIGNRYEKKKLLGEGAFGNIFLVGDKISGKEAAIKIFKDKEQFLNEKRIWELCEGIPGIVQILDSFEENDSGFLVMEYLPGGTLKEEMESGKKEKNNNISECVKRLRPIMEALLQMHSKGMVHCDISPDNILFDQDGNAKLIDFGTVKILKDQEDEIAAGIHFTDNVRVLKERYAAPEQYGNPEKIGPWTDIYEVCAVLYEWITGEKITSVTSRMKNDHLENISLYTKNVGKAERAIMRGLQIEIQKRYFHMGLFMDACGLHVDKYRDLEGILRHKWGKLWILISSQGKFAAPVDYENNKKRILKKKAITVGSVIGFILCAGLGIRYYQTHFQEEKFAASLEKAMQQVQQVNDTLPYTEKEADFQEQLSYLKEFGEIYYEQETCIAYELTEEIFLESGMQNNKCRKMYLDYETLKDACFYFLEVEDDKIISNQKGFSGYVTWNKAGQQTMDIIGKKTENWRWAETNTLEMEYDPIDQRVFDVAFTTIDEEKMEKYLEKVLPLCCPEMFLKENEIEEILGKIKSGSDEVSILCLNEKAWLFCMGYEMQGEFYYQCEIAASKEKIWC